MTHRFLFMQSGIGITSGILSQTDQKRSSRLKSQAFDSETTKRL